MKTIIAAITGVTLTGVLWWGFGGVTRAKEWVSPDGRMSQQSQLDNMSTAIDLWPSSGIRPTTDSLSEITLYRTIWSDPTMERFNISAMATADGAAYRFGVERGSGGNYHDMIFCFEATAPGIATCNFKITTAGAYTTDDGGVTWRRL